MEKWRQREWGREEGSEKGMGMCLLSPPSPIPNTESEDLAGLTDLRSISVPFWQLSCLAIACGGMWEGVWVLRLFASLEHLSWGKASSLRASSGQHLIAYYCYYYWGNNFLAFRCRLLKQEWVALRSQSPQTSPLAFLEWESKVEDFWSN